MQVKLSNAPCSCQETAAVRVTAMEFVYVIVFVVRAVTGNVPLLAESTAPEIVIYCPICCVKMV